MTRVFSQEARRVRGVTGVGVAAALLAFTASGCTGDPATDEPEPTPLPGRSVQSTPTLDPRPVPMDVALARVVGGRLPRPARVRVERQVGQVVSRYLDAAFLAGDYPRSRFPRAFDEFSAGAARSARRDRDLLTNAASGAATVAVVPKRRKVRIDALVPRRAAVGVTARVHLVFVEERTRAADRRVTVTGRLMMDRKRSGAWEIFGYDVARHSVVASKGGRR